MNIICKTENTNILPMCLTLMQNSMAKKFSLICRAKSQRALSALCEKAYAGGYAAFPQSQSRAYAISTFNYPFGLAHGVTFGMTYMYSENQTMELRLAAAKIAEKLLHSLSKKHSSLDCINAVWRYIKNNFTYRMTGDFRDHSAFELLQRKSGVCQAFAALVSLILPYMGVPALYIGGEGLCNGTWVSHGWNCVRMEDGRWEHLDITFSLDALVLQTTATKLGKLVFEQCHRYDTMRYSTEILERTYQNTLSAVHSRITLDMNDTRFYAYGSEFNLQDGEPLFVYTRGKYGVDISNLFFILGGAAVYDGTSDTVMICLYDTFKYIRKASAYILGDGYFDVRILKEAGADLDAKGIKLDVQF